MGVFLGMLVRHYRYLIPIYLGISLIFVACTATYPTPTSTPVAQLIVATPSPLLPTPTSTATATPTPTPQPIWQLLTELGDSFGRVAVTSSGEVWTVGADGLFRFDGQTWQTFSLPDSLREQILTDHLGPQHLLTDLAIAPNGIVWVGTIEDGLYRFEGGTWTHYTTTEGLVDNMIAGLAVDHQNNLWVSGSYTLSRFDGQTWQVVPIDGNAQMSSRLTSLAVTPAGHVWVAVSQDGVYQFDGQSWTGHSQGTREDWNDIVAEVDMFLAAGPNEQVWLGTDGGWLRWTGAGWQGLNVTIPAPFAHPLAMDSAGGAWGLATSGCYFCSLPDLNENGAVYITPDLACRFTAADGLGGAPLDPQPASSDYETPRPDQVWDIAVAADGAVWFITQGQITVFRPQGSICDYASPQAVRTPLPTPTATPIPPTTVSQANVPGH
jgi:streptogramin lyase